jgi:hypothetical protein
MELYNFNETISGTLKNSEKEMGSLFKNGHFTPFNISNAI